MSHITLVRHGQANSDAKTEEDYDRLSPLGHQQTTWLGQHFKAADQHHTRLYSGTLRRQIETAQNLDTGLDLIQDPRLNELEYFTMAQALESEHGIPAPTAPAEFAAHFPITLKAWEDNRIEGAPETFASFQARVADALAEMKSGAGPALAATSGGVIAMSMRLHLGLDVPSMARVGLAIMNSSVHRFFPVGGTWSPVMFNAIPHLETPDRHAAQTHV